MKQLTFFAALFLFILFATPQTLHAQEAAADSIDTFRAYRTEKAPTIDGRLDDDCWTEEGEWSHTFVQQQPNEGKPETEETRLKILYDNHNIYVAFRLYDTEPDKINRWPSPRDQIKGDAVAIVFDSYDDKRTGFAFALTAGGTRADFLCENFSNDDYTWNAVWEGRTSADDKGWYAEFRIPLSQLRYSNKNNEQEWGLHVVRAIDRKLEQDHLSLIPRNNKGLVFSFGRLSGISDLPNSRRIEWAPYTSFSFHSFEKEAGNPYATGSEWGYGVGLDGKIGLSSDFTLDFTVNPDFGQVEADPSTINLTAFETYYDEKRPFFLEGKNIFSMRLGESMFYSRRIGSRPQWSPDSQEGRYSQVPQQTHIISAVKVSGKSKSGLSLGLMNSLTSMENAHITEEGRDEYKMTAQPFTSYSVARVQQDIKGGNTVLGGLLTSVNRSIKDDHLAHLTSNAYTGAVDFEQYFKGREYYAMGALQYSRIEGSAESITQLQQTPTHYFQREGANHLSVDSSARSLSGHAGTFLIGRGGGKKIVSEQLFAWASPGFDLNDMGYLQNAEYKFFRGYVAYVENTPKGIFRDYNIVAFYRFLWDYSDMMTFSRAGFESTMTFANKYYLYLCGFYDPRTVETTLLRGGPPVLLNPRWGTDLSFGTDQSKTIWLKGYHGTMFGSERHAQFMWGEINYRPIPNLGLSARLNYTWLNFGMEYAGSSDIENGSELAIQTNSKAYLLSSFEQNTLGLTLRMDYSITPDLSVQFYGNPFMSSGKYTHFKRATDTRAETFANRFRAIDDALTFNAADNNYSVSERNGDRYTFDNPNFSFREFRFNLVARWEYRPNSILYLVWGQGRSGSADDYISSFTQNTKALFNYPSDNVFMLKLNYWFTL